MTVHIESLKFQCIIGILDFERLNEQDVIVTIKLDYVYTEVFINYADVVTMVKNTMKKEKFLLIEDALSQLSQELKKHFPLINTLEIKISKPSILPDCEVSVSDIFLFNT